MFGADGAKRFVLENAVLAFGERRPAFGLNLVFLVQRLGVGLLVERVYLDLIDCRYDLVVEHEINNAVGIEIADADCLERALAVEFFHCAPRSVHVAEGWWMRKRSR